MTKIKRKFIPGTYDFMFKELVYREETREWLCMIISDITGILYEELEANLKIKNPSLRVNNKNSKKSVTDVIAEVNKTHLNLEMNKYYYEGLMEKNQAYFVKIKEQLIRAGIDYIDIGKLIQIDFNDFNKINSPVLVNKFVMMDKDTGIIENASDIKYYVNLPILDKICYTKDISELTRLEKNLLLMYSDDLELLERISEGEEYMERVVDVLKELNEDEIIIGLYDLEEETKKIERTKEKALQMKYEKMTKEFEEKAKDLEEDFEEKTKELQENFEEKSKDLEEKKKELQAKEKVLEEKSKKDSQMEIATQMLKDNLDINIIIKYTNLTLEELEVLKEQLN